MPPPVWTSLTITTLALSGVALLISLTSLYFTWRTHRRAEAQEARRSLGFIIELVDGRVSPLSSGRL